jgi:hypothetical protein
MDLNRIGGNWKPLKGKIKGQWAIPRDDDLDKIAGRWKRQDPGALWHYQGCSAQGPSTTG